MINDHNWAKVRGGSRIGGAIMTMLIGALVFGFSRPLGYGMMVFGAGWLLSQIVMFIIRRRNPNGHAP